MRVSIHKALKSSSQGFALLEALVSMAIVAFALLHSLALTVSSMRVNQSAQFRTQAVLLSGDIFERMEANNLGAYNKKYDTTNSTSSPPDCLAIVCTPAQLAQFDLAQWQQAVSNRFTSGTGTVTASTGVDPVVYTVTITWSDRRSKTKYATAGNNETFSYVTSKIVYNKA